MKLLVVVIQGKILTVHHSVGDIMTFIQDPEINLGNGIHALCEFLKNAKTAIFF